jgi:hypothetical protein
VDVAQPSLAGKPDQLAAGAAEGMDGAMLAHVELGPLAVELGLGAVARVREPARVFKAPIGLCCWSMRMCSRRERLDASHGRLARRRAEAAAFHAGRHGLALGPLQPERLLVPGEVSDHPGDRVHGLEAPRRLLGREAVEAAQEIRRG